MPRDTRVTKELAMSWTWRLLDQHWSPRVPCETREFLLRQCQQYGCDRLLAANGYQMPHKETGSAIRQDLFSENLSTTSKAPLTSYKKIGRVMRLDERGKRTSQDPTIPWSQHDPTRRFHPNVTLSRRQSTEKPIKPQ